MKSKAFKIFIVVVALVVVVGLGLWLRAKSLIERSYADIPLPTIVANGSPESIARGEMLFQSLCMECHGGADGRATGKRLDEVPAFLGTFWSANLAHPQHGVKHRSDGELSRVLRAGVLPDGRFSAVMSGFNKMGDEDISAILGYMRSGAPAFEESGEDQPRTEISALGAMILTYVSGVNVSATNPSITVPPKAPTVAYGRYMAEVMDCVGCHTDGFGSDKMHDPKAFAGGFEMVDPTGTTIYSRNITPDEVTGIGGWNVDAFQRAVTRGVRPDGTVVRKPMPLFARLDRVDIEALYAFLQTVPKVSLANKAGGHALAKAQSGDAPEVLFTNLGCASCHGDKGPYRDKLSGALAKSDEDVASWILDPQAIRPGSAMPSFQGAIDRAQAEALAKFVKALVMKRGS